MLEKLIEVAWMQCIEDIEEEFSIWLLSIEVFIGHVKSEFVVILDEREHLRDRHFIQLGDDDASDLVDLIDSLVSPEELLEEVLGYVVLRRQILLQLHSSIRQSQILLTCSVM